MSQSLLGDPAHFARQFLHLDFQPPAAFLNTIEHIALNVRSIGFEQVLKEFPGVRLDDFARSNESEEQVGQPLKG